MEVTFIGGGGHCRSLLQMIPNYLTVKGYTDAAPVKYMAAEYLGNDDAVAPGDWLHIAVALGSDDSLKTRRSLIDRLTTNYKFLTLIAPTAICVNTTEIGAGSAVLHGVIINGAKIGPHCIVNTGAIIEHEVRIGENCFIGPGAVICGGVKIGNDVIIGAGATIRNNVSICSDVTIGLGAAVISDITESGVYTGVPARKI